MRGNIVNIPVTFIREMAQRSGLSETTIRRDVKAGKLPYNGFPPSPKELCDWLRLRRWNLAPAELKLRFDALVQENPALLYRQIIDVSVRLDRLDFCGLMGS